MEIARQNFPEKEKDTREGEVPCSPTSGFPRSLSPLAGPLPNLYLLLRSQLKHSFFQEVSSDLLRKVSSTRYVLSALCISPWKYVCDSIFHFNTGS